MTRLSFLFASIGTLALAGPAFADAPPLPPADAPGATASSPMPFVTLDRLAGDSSANVEVSYPSLKSVDGTDSGTALHFDLAGHYVDPVTHFGGYASVPVNYIGASDGNASNTVLGDVEVGGIFAVPTTVRELGVILHAGLTLPTGSKDNAIDNTVAEIVTRPRDVINSIPGFSLRLGASPVIRSGLLIARADVGLDINLSNSSGDTIKPVLDLGVGVGVQLPAVAVTAEFNFVHVFSDSTDDSSDDSNIETAALAVRFTGGAVRPYAAIYIPLDSDSRDLYDFGITGGIAVQLR